MTPITFDDIKVGDVIDGHLKLNNFTTTILCAARSADLIKVVVINTIYHDTAYHGAPYWVPGEEVAFGRAWFDTYCVATYIGTTGENNEEAKNAARIGAGT